jgi:hypothetical protein
LLYLRFCCRLVILIWSRFGQIHNVSGNCIKVRCVPSATCGTWLYQKYKQRSGHRGFCSIQFLNFYDTSTLYVTLPPCSSVYSLNQKAVFASVLPFIRVKLKYIFKYWNVYVLGLGYFRMTLVTAQAPHITAHFVTSHRGCKGG